jgi:cell division protein FtsN
MAKPANRSMRTAPPRRSGGSFLLGMFFGIILGLGIALGVAFYLNKTPLPFLGKSKPAGDSKESAVQPQKPIAGMPQGVAKGTDRDKPKFDFYKILPGGEEPVTEKELKDAAKADKGQPEAAKAVYFIQAGSFQNPADADNQKARIALLGYESSVDPTPLPDKGTWYRVRMGPYTSLEDLNRVRRVLSQNGIDANLVKANPAPKDN